MKWRTGLGLALALGAAAGIATPATSQQVCLQLESQLVQLEQQNNQAAYNQLAQQYERARANYDAAYQAADRAGCIPRLLRFAVPAGCEATRAQLDAQLNQLTQLQQQLRSFSSSQNVTARNNILRALAANNCGPQYEAYGNQGGGRLLDRLFGQPQNDFGPVPLVVTYRTLCVRPCDGYYFPISFSTTQSQFQSDQRTCQAQCPGAALYVHENPGEPVETAVSLNGQRYTQLENAFAYRESYHPECGCQPATQIVREEEPAFTPIGPEAAEAIAAVALTPLPTTRPEPTEDPETIANRLGGFEPGAFTLGEVADTNTVMITDDGLRLIGPAYYYAQ
jgi:hypothetical protein